MRRYDNPESYDVAVIGAGHAGIEAALAAARLGMRVVIFAVNLDSVGNMPCNPSIGGTGKGHLVRELDALGGEMGRAADETSIQTRMLNRGKGAAVYSLRAQIDRRAYQERMKRVLERTPGLDVRQAEVVAVERADASESLPCAMGGGLTARSGGKTEGLCIDAPSRKEADNPSVACGDSSPCTGEPRTGDARPYGAGEPDNVILSGADGVREAEGSPAFSGALHGEGGSSSALPPRNDGLSACGDACSDGNAAGWRVVTRLGAAYSCKAVVVATGTFLSGRIFVGDVSYEGGPDGMFAAASLSESLRALGVPLRRFKTGTPCRVHRASVALDEVERQSGDERPEPFSFETRTPPRNLADCYITYTNEETHRIIRENINRSALYGGQITGVGPRYCPSIEDKVTRFPDRKRHQLFIEPMGLNTEELYLQGMSTSLPEEVQIGMVRSVKGLENAVFTRTAYAIEYDCVDPTALLPTLEFRALPGLYGAGQFNGTSGYEEAAAQGFVAGVNAALKLKGEDPLVLTRDGSYIGTLIDDLVTCGTNEPYRMMTSRSEYRLTLRQDNADERLTPIGRRIGLISDERWADFNEKYSLVAAEEKRLKKAVLPPSEALNALLEELGTTPVSTGVKLAELLKRPEVDYEALAAFDSGRPELRREVWEEAVIRIRYEGYIARQNAQIAEAKRAEATLLPPDIDYDDVYGLRIEARAKLKAIRPLNVGQASRIPGVNPADVEILLIYLRKKK